jgi:hypothetical protein
MRFANGFRRVYDTTTVSNSNRTPDLRVAVHLWVYVWGSTHCWFPLLGAAAICRGQLRAATNENKDDLPQASWLEG